MTLARALQVAAGNSQESADIAEAIDFDGTNDYLYRATSLTGSSNVKTFTFSAFVYLQSTGTTQYIFDNSKYYIYVQSSGSLNIRGAGSVLVLNANTPSGSFPFNTFVNIVVSIDMANTSNRYVYFNDVQQSVTWTTYSNAPIWFDSGTSSAVGASYDGAYSFLKGRISNLFLDLTYRNLSIEANRRLFVTADLKPAADQAALNPLIYLPMSDPTAPGVNAGTGGNFTLTGTVARSGRGPNQYNAPYSDLDGTSDFLERTSALTGLADGKVFTFQCVFNTDVTTIGKTIFTIANNTTARFYLQLSSGPGINMDAYNSSGTRILESQIRLPGFTSFVPGRNYVLTVSIDMANTANRHVYVNGQAAGMNWYTYTNDVIDFLTATPRCYVGQSAASSLRWDGDLGAVWFNTSYIDLSVADNLAKFVTGTGIDAKPVDLGASGELPTGTAPLIYLPMYGNNAGKNYGTGGDFTVNSGPYTGARGPNEYWGNLADFNGTTGYLTKASALTGITDSKTLSISFAMYMDVLSGQMFFTMGDSSTTRNRGVLMNLVSGGSYRLLDVYAYNSAGSQILSARLPLNMVAGVLYYVQFSADLSDTAKRSAYINGAVQSVTWNTYTNSDISFSTATYLNVGRDPVNTAEFYNGKLSEFYLSNQYVDFTQEANRLKFRDAFGNPVNLTQQIEDAAIPNPAIYMRFPPTAFGTNYGTGGNFTVNGTITDGGQL